MLTETGLISAQQLTSCAVILRMQLSVSNAWEMATATVPSQANAPASKVSEEQTAASR